MHLTNILLLEIRDATTHVLDSIKGQIYIRIGMDNYRLCA